MKKPLFQELGLILLQVISLAVVNLQCSNHGVLLLSSACTYISLLADTLFNFNLSQHLVMQYKLIANKYTSIDGSSLQLPCSTSHSCCFLAKKPNTQNFFILNIQSSIIYSSWSIIGVYEITFWISPIYLHFHISMHDWVLVEWYICTWKKALTYLQFEGRLSHFLKILRM